MKLRMKCLGCNMVFLKTDIERTTHCHFCGSSLVCLESSYIKEEERRESLRDREIDY